MLTLAFNLLLPAAVLADTKAEYQQCLANCYDSGLDWTQEQLSSCIHQCFTTYPNGAAESTQSMPSDTTVNVGLTKTTNQNSKASFTFTPNVAIGGLFTADAKIPVNADLFPDYINTWYTLLLGTVGILATIMVMWGGFKWLLARGDSGKITEAKSVIFSALAGLALALLSYTLISIISPSLTIITGQEFEPVVYYSSNNATNNNGIGTMESVNKVPSGSNAATGNMQGLKPQTSSLANSISSITDAQPTSAYRPQDTGSNHANGTALDYPRNNTTNAYFRGLIKNQKTAFYYDGQPGYVLNNVTINNIIYPEIRVIDEPVNNCWHIDMGKPPKLP